MDEIKRIVTDIKNRNIKPIYLLQGDEPYYIDKISEYIEDNILSEEEKGFNQVILYGKETTVGDIIASSKRFPMMAEHQVVIIKEAQDLARTIDQLEDYVQNPQPSTVLVLCYKYKKLDARTKVFKGIKKNGLVFESKKLYDNQVGDWIQKVLAGKQYKINYKACQMLVEFLGTDLGTISKELEKLRLIIPPGNEITPEDIEKNIGISKDYNQFELQAALATKDVTKAVKIINYFGENEKNNPMVFTVTMLFTFFSALLKYHGASNKSWDHMTKKVGIRSYLLKNLKPAASLYPLKKVSTIISILNEYDAKSKGMGSKAANTDLMREMITKIMA
ncbi:DNA polymerase III subunit delta [Spongiivirga sp. MCCC 1A20706]|uniref:DNA polymerase III subunit delta n=1 Tax=Spongiivirga sp. MCCC 1A20706 TaxID=3160963 RepID=UPI0039776A0D